jgi:hypothetical protein
VNDKLDRIGALLHEHIRRFDSLDAQLRHLTQLVREVLKRLPEPDQAGD